MKWNIENNQSNSKRLFIEIIKTTEARFKFYERDLKPTLKIKEKKKQNFHYLKQLKFIG
jgi:hypothetical protein